MGKLNVVIPATNVIVEGVEYRKVEREAQAGDIVRHDAAGYSFLPQGAFYRTYIDGDGDVVIDDEDGDWHPIDEDFAVFEPVSKLVTKPARLKVGDYAKVFINSGFNHDSVKVGDIYVIKRDEGGSVPFLGEPVDNKSEAGPQWFYEKDIVRATDEEVAAAKDALETKFNVGDKVKLINGAGQRHLHGFTNGEICEVISGIDEDGDVKIKRSKGRVGYAKPGQLAKATAEELAKEALTAKWNAIGRKVNEFKAGDVVRVLEDRSAAGVKSGDLEVVKGTEFGLTNDGVRLEKMNPSDMNAWMAVIDIELVTPVEQRFDRVG